MYYLSLNLTRKLITYTVTSASLKSSINLYVVFEYSKNDQKKICAKIVTKVLYSQDKIHDNLRLSSHLSYIFSKAYILCGVFSRGNINSHSVAALMLIYSKIT